MHDAACEAQLEGTVCLYTFAQNSTYLNSVWMLCNVFSLHNDT